MYDGHEEAALCVDGDGQVLTIVVSHGSCRHVDGGVDLGELLECFDGCLAEERQERELDTFARIELALYSISKLGDASDVNFDNGRELS